MDPLNPLNPTSTNPLHTTVQVIDIQEEKKLEKEAQALVELHDFIKAHPDSPVKEIAKFMPPIDSRAVSKAIQMLAIRDQSITQEQKDAIAAKAASMTVQPRKIDWAKGKK